MSNYLKGTVGDGINLILAAAAFNFKKRMREVQIFFIEIIINVIFKNNHLGKMA